MEDYNEYLVDTNREAINNGLPELEVYGEVKFPQTDFKIKEVLGDIIMAKFDDCNDDNTEIYRDGIWLNIDITRGCWRSAVVIKAGPATSALIREGTRIAFPNDKGIKAVQISGDGNKENLIFINEERIFGILEPKENNVDA